MNPPFPENIHFIKTNYKNYDKFLINFQYYCYSCFPYIDTNQFIYCANHVTCFYIEHLS